MNSSQIIVVPTISRDKSANTVAVIRAGFRNYESRNGFIRDAIPTQGFAYIESLQWYTAVTEVLDKWGRKRVIVMRYNRAQDYALFSESTEPYLHLLFGKDDGRRIWSYDLRNRNRNVKCIAH